MAKTHRGADICWMVEGGSEGICEEAEGEKTGYQVASLSIFFSQFAQSKTFHKC